MSYEAWGDDDDGLDGVREAYRKTLLEDGWLDDEQAAKLRREIEYLRSLSANPSATKGTGVTPVFDDTKPPARKLVFNKDTKRIDMVRNFDGLVMDSFDPPTD